jgi:hypothetical protein
LAKDMLAILPRFFSRAVRAVTACYERCGVCVRALNELEALTLAPR